MKECGFCHKKIWTPFFGLYQVQGGQEPYHYRCHKKFTEYMDELHSMYQMVKECGRNGARLLEKYWLKQGLRYLEFMNDDDQEKFIFLLESWPFSDQSKYKRKLRVVE